MARYDQTAARLRLAAQTLLASNKDVYFAADTFVNTAMTVSRGSETRAEELLRDIEQFLSATLQHHRELCLSGDMTGVLDRGIIRV